MPLESLAQAMNRISSEVRGGPLSRMAEGGPVMKAYEPSWRDRIASVLMGDERSSPERRNFVQGLMGSTGLGTTGLGVADVLPGGQALAAQEALREGDYKGAALAVVPIPAARRLGTAVSLPQTEAFQTAVRNTPGARINEGYLEMPLQRGQRAAQHGEESVRGGVFYLPEGSPNARYYSGTKANYAYGGQDKIKGETAIANPLFVKGATGGKAPEAAYIQLKGPDAFKQLNDDVMRALGIRHDKPLQREIVAEFLDKHAPSLSGMEQYIIENSSKGNQLRYALQEAAVAQAARDAGHDAVLGYSTSTKTREPFISEVFDVRERNYPTPQGGYDVWPEFEIRKADGGAVDQALDLTANYDPMGNVTMPPEEGFAPSPIYDKAMDAIAKSGAAMEDSSAQDRSYRSSILPISRDAQGNTRFDPSAGILGSLYGAAQLPGDVYAGRVDPMSEKGFERAQELAQLAMTGGFGGVPAKAGQAVLGSGPVRRPLTEKQFYRQYVMHKDIRSASAEERDNVLKAIQSEGFQPNGNVNALPPYSGGKPKNIVDQKYAPREGDFVYFIPKDGYKNAPNGPQVKQGWKPESFETGTVERDFQPMYELYLKQFEKAHKADAKVGTDVAETSLKSFDVQAFSPKPVAEAFEQTPAPNVLRDDIIGEITRSIDSTEGAAAKLPTTMGLGPMYVVESGVKPEGKGFLLNETKNANAEKQLGGIDPLMGKYPEMATDPQQWAAAMTEATGRSNVLSPPYRFMKELSPGGDYENLLKTMTPGQISDRQKGFANGKEFLNAFSNGEMKVEDTGKLFMWGILSRGVDPFTHEGLFLDAFNGIEPWVKLAAEGKFTKDVAEGPYKEWAASVSPKGSGQAGSGAVHNLNAFGRDFLTKIGTPDAAGVTPMQKLHDMMSDPSMSGRQIRREFAKIGEGVGIDNKVVSFILLATGRDDVMVIDRIQLKNLWDDGRFGDVNIWDGISVPVVKMADGKTKRFPPTEEGRSAARDFSAKNKGSKVENAAVTGSSLAEATYGAKGILVYEALEDALSKSVPDLYKRAGLNEPNATPGMFHWDTWVARSNQEASHGTLGSILAKAKGSAEPLSGVYSRQGDYQTYAYGSKYGVSPEGPFYLYPLLTGEEVRLSPQALSSVLEAVKNPKFGVVPKGFKVTETTGRPWYEREGVNRAKLDELIRAAGESSAAGGSGGQAPGAVRRASGGPVSDGAGDGAGGGRAGEAGRAKLLKLAAEHGLHCPQVAHALRQNNPSLTPEAATSMAKSILSGERSGLQEILSDKLMKDLRRALRDHHVRGRS